MAITATTLTSTAFLTTMFYGSMAAAAASIGTGIYSSIQQSRQQAAQAKYQEAQSRQQAAIQRQNQQLAEEQASAQRRQGYEEMLNTRRKAAALVGSQRAAAGASGTAVDFGSNADVGENTMEQAEFDAINAYNRGIDTSYNTELQAWNYGQQASGYDMQADAYGAQASAARSAGLTGAISSAAGGIAQLGSTWAGYAAKQPGGKKGINGLEFGDFFPDFA